MEVVEQLNKASKVEWMLLVMLMIVATTIINDSLSIMKDHKKKQLSVNYEYVSKKKRFKQFFLKNERLAIGSVEKTRIMLVRSGEPFKWLGIDEYNYNFFRGIFGISSGLLISTTSESVYFSIAYGIMGFYIINAYHKMKIKKRHKMISENMDGILHDSIIGLHKGETPYEIISAIMRKMKSDNPLSLEFKLLSTGIKHGDLRKAFNNFRMRIGLEDIDNYCFAFMQYEIGNNAAVMMNAQLDLLKTKKESRQMRKTKVNGNLSGIASVLVIVAIIAIVLLPLIINFKTLNFGG